MKAAVLAIAEERKGEGWTQASVAAELGINEAMLSNWKRELRRTRSNLGKLRPVALLDESPQKEVPRALVLPSGVRIEGLELGELMALIRELT
jgi:transcriptional regulator with XRE-family HTH domain